MEPKKQGEELIYVAEVKVRDKETLDRALRRFRQLCLREGILRGLKERRYYQKPSEERRRKTLDAKRRQRRGKG